MKHTPETRTGLVQSKVSEHMARGINYDEAYRLAMKHPEVVEAFQDAQIPQDVVAQERQAKQAAELESATREKMLKLGVDYDTAFRLVVGASGSEERVKAAVDKIQKDLGVDYNKAWEMVRRDPEFADVFTQTAVYKTRDE